MKWLLIELSFHICFTFKPKRVLLMLYSCVNLCINKIHDHERKHVSIYSRLYPVIPANARVIAEQDIQVGGYLIPKKVSLLADLCCTCAGCTTLSQIAWTWVSHVMAKLFPCRHWLPCATTLRHGIRPCFQTQMSFSPVGGLTKTRPTTRMPQCPSGWENAAASDVGSLSWSFTSLFPG